MGVRAVTLILLGLAGAGCDLVFAPAPTGGPDGGPGDDAGNEPDAAVFPDAPIGGHDEDEDGIPDVTDPCPHIAGTAADEDGDGVGDDCDPERLNPRQHRFYWNGFDVGRDDLIGSGTVTVAGDAARLDGVGSAVSTLYHPDLLEHAQVSTRFVVDAIVPATPRVEVAVVSGHLGGGGNSEGMSCRVGRDLGAPTMVYIEIHQQTGPTSDVTRTMTSTTAQLVGWDTSIQITHDTVASNFNCQHPVIGLNSSNNVPVLAPGQVGIAASRLDARFLYLFIVTTDPSS